MPSSRTQSSANEIGEAPPVPRPGETKAAPPFSDAPENSTIMTTMNTRGQVFQVRVFKSHPDISKVESTWTGRTERYIRIFLRNGEIKEVTSGSAPDLKTLTASQLMDMAGIIPKRIPDGRSNDGDSNKNKRVF
jgi:hypothetical protein